MKKLFTLFTALLFAVVVNATIPSTDFASGYTFRGSSDAEYFTTEGDITYNSTDDYLFYTNHTTNGTATWHITATNSTPSEISVKFHIGDSKSGHQYKIEIYNSSDALVGSVKEAATSWTGNSDISASGSIILPDGGSYSIVLYNLTSWSTSIITGVTLTGKSIPSTDFASPGITLAADDAVLNGSISSSFQLYTTSTPHYIKWYDRSKSAPAMASWKINATRACRISATLDIGPEIGSNWHIFEVKVLDAEGVEVGAVEEGPAYGGTEYNEHDAEKALSGTIDIPKAGFYTVELRNNRDYGKGAIKNVILSGHGYTVAGGLNTTTGDLADAIFGTSWDEEETANDMDIVNGEFLLVKKDISLTTSDNVYFKVVEDHSWSTSYPAQNCTLTVASNGTYDIRITYNYSTHAVSARAVTTTPRPVKLAGTFYESINPDWAISAQTMDDAEDHLTCSKIVSLQPGFYEFKIVDNGTWNGNTGDMVRTNCTGWVMTSATDERCGITIDVAGDYIFTYNYFDYKASVTYPMTFTREVANTNYGTICLPCAAVLTGATAYSVDPAHVAEGYVTLTEVGTELTAGVPYIIKPEAVGTISAVMSGDAVASPVNNNLYGVWGATQTFGAGEGVYALHDNKLTLVSGSAHVNVPSTKAYFKVAAASAPVLRILEGEEIVTNISDVKDEEQTIKFIENGQLFIRKNGIVYDALGRAVR